MKKPEAKYKYLLNQDKYDPEVRKAVAQKSITHSEANKINSIQEMMAKERQKKHGLQEGDGSDHNTGRNDAIIYEHQRIKSEK